MLSREHFFSLGSQAIDTRDKVPSPPASRRADAGIFHVVTADEICVKRRGFVSTQSLAFLHSATLRLHEAVFSEREDCLVVSYAVSEAQSDGVAGAWSTELLYTPFPPLGDACSLPCSSAAACSADGSRIISASSTAPAHRCCCCCRRVRCGFRC